LLKEIEKASGKNHGEKGTASPLSNSRKTTAAEAGMSERQEPDQEPAGGVRGDRWGVVTGREGCKARSPALDLDRPPIRS